MTDASITTSWTALLGALIGTAVSGVTLAFYFGGEMRQTATNTAAIAELRQANLADPGTTQDAIHTAKIEALSKQVAEMQQQIVNGRNAIIRQDSRIGVIESRLDDLRKER